MATTTPNFGFDIPQSTDLVKDGATAIAALGTDIDTAFVDLKGGTTGQVLAKASGTDLDFSWVAQDDSNAIQNAIVDAKGDLIGATAADTPARLAVGTDGQVLTADSTAATGLAWATAGGTPTFVGCMLRKSDSSQSIANDTYAIVTFDNEIIDTDGFHDNTTNNSRITIPTGKGGKYLVTAVVHYAAHATGYRKAFVTKNGAVFTGDSIADQRTGGFSGSGSEPTFNGIVELDAGDYLMLNGWQNSGTTLNMVGFPSAFCYFSATYLGA